MSWEAWGDDDVYDSWADRAMDAGWFDPTDYSPGAIAILKERERQETAEGWTPAHDDGHTGGELAMAASCYAWIAGAAEPDRKFYEAQIVPVEGWPWGEDWWKPKDRLADLVRAGALIAAEIDRLKRKAEANENKGAA